MSEKYLALSVLLHGRLNLEDALTSVTQGQCLCGANLIVHHTRKANIIVISHYLQPELIDVTGFKGAGKKFMSLGGEPHLTFTILDEERANDPDLIQDWIEQWLEAIHES